MWVEKTEPWIKALKIGDKVITLEIGVNVPGIEPNEEGFCVLENVSTVIGICDAYIETTWVREFNPAWSNFERAYKPQFCKNYFGPDGTINIKEYNAL